MQGTGYRTYRLQPVDLAAVLFIPLLKIGLHHDALF